VQISLSRGSVLSREYFPSSFVVWLLASLNNMMNRFSSNCSLMLVVRCDFLFNALQVTVIQ